MAIKIVFALIMLGGVAFLSRVLVAFIGEAALARRGQSPDFAVITALTHIKRAPRKLARLRPVDPYSVRARNALASGISAGGNTSL